VVSDPPEAPDPAPKPAGETAPAQRGYLGVLTPRAAHDVLAPFTTTLSEVKVQLGDRVQAKQLIARFDDHLLKQDLAAQSSTLRQHGSEIATRKVALDSARKELDNERIAFADKIVPKSNVDRAESKVHEAEAQLAGANASYDTQSHVVEKLQSQLNAATVLAPADGRVSMAYRREGERVEEGQAILQIISSDDLFIKFAIPGDKAGTIAEGDEVDVVLEQAKAKAVVRHVQPSLDPIAQMIMADADLVGAADKLQGGQRCRIVPRPKKP
jgi:multidrug efflux pump subunit AcrA (membrane-fusion protein)